MQLQELHLLGCSDADVSGSSGNGSTGAADSGRSFLRHLTSLTKVELGCRKLVPGSVASLATLPSLQDLTLGALHPHMLGAEGFCSLRNLSVHITVLGTSGQTLRSVLEWVAASNVSVVVVSGGRLAREAACTRMQQRFNKHFAGSKQCVLH